MTRKLGRRPPHPRDTHPRLALGPFLRTDQLPPTPADIDWMSAVTDWPVYLNDRIGDCTIAAAGHMIEAWTRYGQGATVEVSDADVLTAYEAVSGYDPHDPATDQGAVMQDVLGYWRKTGVGGHRILAFAELDVTRLDQVYAALDLFGAVYIGVNLPNAALGQFDADQPWAVVADDGGIAGGHAVNLGRRDGAALQVVTWGRPQGLDEAWWRAYVEEAWVAVTQEWVDAHGDDPQGLDTAALGAAFTELTGQPSPFPAPVPPAPQPPTPNPSPGPTPDPADLAYVAAVDAWAHHRHHGDNATAAHAYLTWKQAKGL